MANGQKKTCLVIGAVGKTRSAQAARLEKLANDVIRPLITTLDASFEVSTLLDLPAQAVIREGIGAVDRADLVIADLTEHTPDVDYLLAVCHCVGVPGLIVTEAHAPQSPSAFRMIPLNLAQPEQAWDQLRPVLAEVIQKIANNAVFSNPVVDYFEGPLSLHSPAYGLANGYYLNFIRPVAETIAALDDEGKHRYSIRIRHRQDGQIEDLGKNVAARRNLKLKIILPSQLEFIRYANIAYLRAEMDEALIETSTGRDFSLFARVEDGEYQLYDFPTTLNILENILIDRLKALPPARAAAEYRRMETQELRRFAQSVSLLIANEDGAETRTRVQFLTYNGDHIADHAELKWLQETIEQAAPGNLIFISYRRADWDEYVQPLVKRLEAEGLRVWIDQSAIEGSDDWLDAINAGLETCERMILCVSPEALQSKYVKMEYRYFFDQDKLLFPLILRETKFPAELQRLQYYDYAEIDKLIQALRKR